MIRKMFEPRRPGRLGSRLQARLKQPGKGRWYVDEDHGPHSYLSVLFPLAHVQPEASLRDLVRERFPVPEKARTLGAKCQQA
jgi:hypothetical protein